MENKVWNKADLYAYLDGELSATQKEALETELECNQQLMEQLAAEKQLLNLLQEPPLQQVPRNYLLTPEMVQVEETRPKSARRRFTLWGLRLATTLSALVFVVALGLQFAPSGVMPQQLAEAPMMKQDNAVEMEEAVVEEKEVEAEIMMEEVSADEEVPAESRELPATDVAAAEEETAPLPTATASSKNGTAGEGLENTTGVNMLESDGPELCSVEDEDGECVEPEEELDVLPTVTLEAESGGDGPEAQKAPLSWWLISALGLTTLGFAAATWRFTARS